MNTAINVSSITYDHALAVWDATEDSKFWGPVEWIVGIRGRSSLVFLGGKDGESFAVVDVTNGQVLSEDEFSSQLIIDLGTVPLRA